MGKIAGNEATIRQGASRKSLAADGAPQQPDSGPDRLGSAQVFGNCARFRCNSWCNPGWRMGKLASILAFVVLFADGARPQQQPPPFAGGGGVGVGGNQSQPRPDQNGVYFAGPGIVAPLVIERAPVEYPADVPNGAIEGMTILKLVVGADGLATNISIVSSHGAAFDEAATDAIRRCKFDPGTLNGDPVSVHVFARVRFFEDKRDTYPRILSRYGLGAGMGTPAARNYDRPPVAIYIAPAEFSEKARKAKYQGVVLVSATINEEGLPTDVKVVKSLGMGLDEKAIESVYKSRFRPATKDGAPVAAQITIEVNFRLY